MKTIYFNLEYLQPDKRQWKTAMPVLVPDVPLKIAVEIPDEHKYIHNMKEILLAEMSGEKSIMPILTPLGLAFVEDALLSRIDETEEKKAENEKIAWENEEE